MLPTCFQWKRRGRPTHHGEFFWACMLRGRQCRASACACQCLPIFLQRNNVPVRLPHHPAREAKITPARCARSCPEQNGTNDIGEGKLVESDERTQRTGGGRAYPTIR